jgi:omega-6 fatty acid desaturase (delta-12 desaturase)
MTRNDHPHGSWMKIARAYGAPDHRRSIIQLTTTVVPLAGLWLLMMQSLTYGYWLTLLLAIPAAGFLVRLFMIQHDCGHGSFFRSRALNDLVGRVIGVFTLTAYDDWRNAHAIHHATSGNLCKRGTGDVDLLTVSEYRALSWWGRLTYRLYRHPIVLFGIGPIYLFVVKHRFPLPTPPGRKRIIISVLWTNLAIAASIALGMVLFGAVDFLMVQLPITILASSIGVWLFFVQHNFENAYWAKSETWKYEDAALHGSSYYELPAILRWFTADIGLHHIHHLYSKIPNYKLRDCIADNPALREFSRLTLWQSLKCVRLTLWDETQNRLVGFRQVRAARARIEPTL